MFFTGSILIFDVILWLKLIAQNQSIYVLSLPYYVCYCFTSVIELIFWQFVHSIKIRIILLNENLLQITGEDEMENLFVRIDRKKINNIVDTLKIDTDNNLRKNVDKKCKLL